MLRFLAQYKKIKQIGFGAYSTIYLYRHRLRKKKQIVLKEIQRDAYHPYEEQHLKQLETKPGICTLYSTLTTPHHVYLLLKYYPGGDLLDNIHQMTTPLQQEWVKNSMNKMSALIHVCHQHGIAHLDIKPENFVFDKHGTLILIDFGMSRPFVAEQPSTLYSTFSALGSDTYASPESCQRMYCGKSDVWSLGIIFRHFCAHMDPCPIEYLELLDWMLQQDVQHRASIQDVCTSILTWE